MRLQTKAIQMFSQSKARGAVHPHVASLTFLFFFFLNQILLNLIILGLTKDDYIDCYGGKFLFYVDILTLKLEQTEMTYFHHIRWL